MNRKWLVSGAVLAVLSSALLCSACLTVPLAPDRADLQRFAPPAKEGIPLQVVPLLTGHATAPRCAAAGEASCFSSGGFVHAAYLVKHPKGAFLIDSGLSAHGRDDLARFPALLRIGLEYTPDEGLGQALAAAGNPKLDFVVLTHAHWDHTSGLRDLKSPRVIFGPGEGNFVANFPLDGTPAVMPDHLRGARLETFAWDGPPYENFPASHDLFGDGSVVLVPLPGHTPGSLGVFLNHVNGKRLFFVGDAAWSLDAIRLPSHKLRPLSNFADHDRARLSDTLWRLHHLQQHEPELVIVPAHDRSAFDAVQALATASASREAPGLSGSR